MLWAGMPEVIVAAGAIMDGTLAAAASSIVR